MDIRTYLFKKELSIGKLAEACGLSRSHLNQVLTGKKPFTKKIFILIENATNGKVTKQDLEKPKKKRIRSK